jgi:hypothetical protein
MIKMQLEIDGEIKTVELENEHHVAAFIKNGWTEVEEEPKNKGGRPKKIEE